MPNVVFWILVSLVISPVVILILYGTIWLYYCILGWHGCRHMKLYPCGEGNVREEDSGGVVMNFPTVFMLKNDYVNRYIRGEISRDEFLRLRLVN